QCHTSNASAEYRKALFNEPVTQISASLSGRPARGLLNHWHTQIDLPNRPSQPEYPYTYDLAKQLNAIASKNKDYGFGAFWAGSNVSQIRELDAADLVNQLVVEMLEDE
ncbi:nitronate monooxygenase, partial [Acinetobacter sp. A11]